MQTNLHPTATKEPNLVRAYTARSEVFLLVHQQELEAIAKERMYSQKVVTHRRKRLDLVEKAIRDISRAIHLKPHDTYLYLARGRLLLKQLYEVNGMSGIMLHNYMTRSTQPHGGSHKRL